MNTYATPEGTAAYAARFRPLPDAYRRLDGLCLSNLGLGTYLGQDTPADDERYQDADAALGAARKALSDSKWDRNRAAWKDELSRVERKLRAKQG